MIREMLVHPVDHRVGLLTRPWNQETDNIGFAIYGEERLTIFWSPAAQKKALSFKLNHIPGFLTC
jgi:hypothetical protein